MNQNKKDYIYKWRAENKDKVKEYNKITLDRRIQKAVDIALKANGAGTQKISDVDEYERSVIGNAWLLLHCLEKLEKGIITN